MSVLTKVIQSTILVICVFHLVACGGGGDGGGASFGGGAPNSSLITGSPTEAPFAAILAADNTGFSDTDQYTNKRTLRYTVTIPDSGTGLEYTTNFGAVWTSIGFNLASKTQTLTLAFSTDGQKTLQLRATNGSTGSLKGPVFTAPDIIIDTVPPNNQSFSTPLGGIGTTTNRQFQWRWTKTSGGADDMYFDVRLDGVLVAAKAVNEFWQSPTDMPLGNRTLTVQAYDRAGNPAPAIISSTMTVN